MIETFCQFPNAKAILLKAPVRLLPCLLLTLLIASSARGQCTLLNPPFSVDGLRLIEGAPALLSGARPNGVAATGNGGAIGLADGTLTGQIELAPIKTEFPFNEAIPSWNGIAPAGTGFRVWMRVGTDTQMDSWFAIGQWGEVQPPEIAPRIQQIRDGVVQTDYLALTRLKDAAAFKIEFFRREASLAPPTVSMVALSYTNTTGDKALWKSKGDRSTTTVSAGGKMPNLTVPFRSQVVPNTEWIGRICSPASVSMALEHFGANIPTQDVAAELYDPGADMFGNWNRAIQGAAQHGVRGYLGRYRSFSAVRDALRQGAVVCASIRFEFGELDPANLPRMYAKRGTKGHLLVVKGFTADGQVVVNDSASKDYGRDSLWRQEDLAKAWFDKGGVAYVMTPKGPAK